MKPTIEYPGEYQCLKQMKNRCYNPKGSDYKNYGGRGITVCERWRDSFENFIADMGRRPENHSIERIDNSLGYSPDNCKWATRREQAQNRRNMNKITFNGISLTLNGWAKHLGITSAAIHKRKKANLSIDKLLAPRHPKYDLCYKKVLTNLQPL